MQTKPIHKSREISPQEPEATNHSTESGRMYDRHLWAVDGPANRATEEELPKPSKLKSGSDPGNKQMKHEVPVFFL